MAKRAKRTRKGQGKKRIANAKVIKVGRKYYRYRTSFATARQARKFARRARRRGYGVRIRKHTTHIYRVYTRG